MKQGQASHSSTGATKTEPVSHTVDPCTAATIGQAGYSSTSIVYEGRGLEAPMKGTTVHNKGSQGNH